MTKLYLPRMDEKLQYELVSGILISMSIDRAMSILFGVEVKHDTEKLRNRHITPHSTYLTYYYVESEEDLTKILMKWY